MPIVSPEKAKTASVARKATPDGREEGREPAFDLMGSQRRIDKEKHQPAQLTEANLRWAPKIPRSRSPKNGCLSHQIPAIESLFAASILEPVGPPYSLINTEIYYI
jgi:hypothetical protein